MRSGIVLGGIFGILWYCLVFCGFVCYCAVLCSNMCCRMALPGIIRCLAVLCDVGWYCVVLYGTVW